MNTAIVSYLTLNNLRLNLQLARVSSYFVRFESGGDNAADGFATEPIVVSTSFWRMEIK